MYIPNTIGEDIAILNHFLYKGYYFDDETEWYYLKSRYYDSNIVRFINGDNYSELKTEDLVQTNLFTYCSNNLVMYTDSTGYAPEWLKTAAVITGVVLVVAAVTILTCGVGTGMLIGAITVGVAKGALIGAAVGAYLGASSWFATQAANFTVNPITNEVVLGKSGAYQQVANSRGATHFLSPQWQATKDMFGVGSRGMWRINRVFLDTQIAAGKTFMLAVQYLREGISIRKSFNI